MSSKKSSGGGTSKTARASMRASVAKGGFERAADAALFVPLNGGEHAYVFGADGKTLHVAVASEQFVAAAAEAVAAARDSGRARNVLVELDKRYPGKGWAEPLAAPRPDAV